MMVRKFSWAAAILALVVATGAQAQQGVSLATGFTDFRTWDTFGSATTSVTTPGNGFIYSDLRLTQFGSGGQAGAGFAPVALVMDFNQAFNFDFHFFIPDVAGLRGDGFTFTMSGAPALGSGGSGLGYEGLSDSVAFAVDTFHFSGDPVSPSLQMLQGGSVIPLASTETGMGDSIRDPNFQFYATVSYAPSGNEDETGLLTGSIFHPNFATVSVSGVVDFSQLGVVLDANNDPAGHLVYYGFTAGNGLATDGHIITSAVPLPVPEPSTYAMLMAGLATLGFVAHRRLQHRQTGRVFARIV